MRVFALAWLLACAVGLGQSLECSWYGQAKFRFVDFDKADAKMFYWGEDEAGHGDWYPQRIDKISFVPGCKDCIEFEWSTGVGGGEGSVGDAYVILEKLSLEGSGSGEYSGLAYIRRSDSPKWTKNGRHTCKVY